MKVRWVFLSLTAAILGLVAVAEARPRGDCDGRHRGKRLERYIDRLDLDSATREKVQAILDAAKQDRKELRARLRPEFEQMRSLLEQGEPDEAAIMRQVEKIGALKTEGRKAMLGTLLQVRALLTPEQRDQLMEMKRAEREKRRDRREHRWDHEGGGPQDG